MRYVNRFYMFFLSIIILLLNNCLYKRNYLKTFSAIEKSAGYSETIDNQIVFVKALSAEESYGCFNVNLVSRGYIPLYIKIANNSPDTLVIRSSYIDLIPCSSQSIAKLLHYDTSLYTWSLAVPALVFWWPATLAVGSLGYDMYRANRKTNQRVDECTLYGQNFKILPYEVIEKFMFIHKNDYDPCFEFKIFNKDQKKLLNYHVNLIY